MSGNLGVKLGRIEALLAQILERLPATNGIDRYPQIQDVEPSAPKDGIISAHIQAVVPKRRGRPPKVRNGA